MCGKELLDQRPVEWSDFLFYTSVQELWKDEHAQYFSFETLCATIPGATAWRQLPEPGGAVSLYSGAHQLHVS